jgi:hypothetical protein
MSMPADLDDAPEKLGARALTLWWVVFSKLEEVKGGPSDYEKFKTGAVCDLEDDVIGGYFRSRPSIDKWKGKPDAQLGFLYASGALTDDDGFVHLVGSTIREENGIIVQVDMEPLQVSVQLGLSSVSSSRH